MSQLTVDPDTLLAKNFTIAELKQRLTSLHVTLPSTDQNKDFYFQLYKQTLKEKQQQDQTPPPSSLNNSNKKRPREMTPTSLPFNDEEETSSSSAAAAAVSRPSKKTKQTVDINAPSQEGEDDDDEVMTNVQPINRHSIAVDVSNQPLLTTVGSGASGERDDTSVRRTTVADVPQSTTAATTTSEMRRRPVNAVKPVGVISASLQSKLSQPAPVVIDGESPLKSTSSATANAAKSPSMMVSPSTVAASPISRGDLSPDQQVISPGLSTPRHILSSGRKSSGNLSTISGGGSRQQARLSLLPGNVSRISIGGNGLTNIDVSQFVEEVDDSFSFRKCFVGSLVGLMWIILIIASYLVIFGSVYDPSVPRGPPYCDTEVDGTLLKTNSSSSTVTTQGLLGFTRTTDCQPCPTHGYCAQGRLLKCEDPFVIKNAICVKNEKVVNAAMKMISFMQQELSDLAGKKECGQLVNDRLNNTDLHAMLNIKMYSEEDTQEVLDQALFDAAFKEAYQLMKESSQNLQLQVEGNEQEFVAFSTNPNMNIVCRVRKTAATYQYHITALFVVIAGLIFANIVAQRKREYAKNLNYTVNAVFKALQTKKSLLAVHLRDNLRQNLVERFDLTDQMWDEVRTILLGDSRIIESSDKRGIVWSFDSDADISFNMSTVQAQ